MDIEARPYQAAAIERVLAKIHDRPILVSPTGSGKTFMGVQIIERLRARTLWLAHRRELIGQAAQSLIRLGLKVGVILAGSTPNPAASIQVASIQTLARRALPPADVVVLDECHHARARTYRSVLERYPNTPIIGLTATPFRLDGRGLGDVFGCIEVAASADELVRDGTLVEPLVFAPSDPDLKQVRIRHGDFDEGQIFAAMSKATLIGDIVDTWRKRAPDRRTVVFAVNVAHSQQIVEAFKGAGVRAEHLDGATSKPQRAAILHRLATGYTTVVSNCQVLTEGWDLPALECAIVARPTASLNLHLQCLDDETEILTRRGWIGRKGIAAADELASMDPTVPTPTVAWGAVRGIVNRPLAPGERMYGIESPSMNVRVTGGHRVLVSTRVWAGGDGAWSGWGFRTAEDLASYRSSVRIPVAGVLDAPGVPLTDDELRFIGWFLTDGTLNRRAGQVVISQATNQPHLEEIPRMLAGCGFKFGVHEITPRSQFRANSRQRRYYVSKGTPRGKDRHLRGWGPLESYLDKNLAPALAGISARQLGVLLEAIHLGDGSKQLGQAWTRRSYHVSTVRRAFADRLQALCVTRGWRCNVSTIPSVGARRPLLMIHAKPAPVRTVGGATHRDRPSFSETRFRPGEPVWCVETDLGTIVTRRRGKVAILGNCIGRIMRAAPGKAGAVVLDHAGNHLRLGPVTQQLEYSLEDQVEPTGGRKKGEAPSKRCPECYLVVSIGVTTCPSCGHIWRAEIPESHPGELVEYSEASASRKVPLEEQQCVWDEIEARRVDWCLSPGWSYHQFKERLGFRPLVHQGRIIEARHAGEAVMAAEFERLDEIRRIRQYKPGWVGYQLASLFGPRAWAYTRRRQSRGAA